jgi:hypothetical protein
LGRPGIGANVKIPFAERAVVEGEKVREYLLSATHPVGRFKAAFFSLLGYTDEKWPELQRDLLQIAVRGDAVQGKFSRFGNKYEVPAILTGPSGRSAAVLTVWIVRHGEEIPRLVTAMPGDKP